jgi:predicted MFS family arabinose efflux permease
LIGLSFVGSFCAMPLVTFLPVFAQKVFHRDAKGYSALLAAFGIGAVLGAIAVAGVGHVRRKGILAVAMQMTFGGLMLAFALSRAIVLSYAILFFAGAALMVVFAMFMTLVQSNVEDRLRGRVVSVYSLAFRGAMPLGNLVAGFLAALLTAPRVLMLDGLVLLLVGSVVLLRHSRSGVTSL